jgi:hypothetical protein
VAFEKQKVYPFCFVTLKKCPVLPGPLLPKITPVVHGPVRSSACDAVIDTDKALYIFVIVFENFDQHAIPLIIPKKYLFNSGCCYHLFHLTEGSNDALSFQF